MSLLVLKFASHLLFIYLSHLLLTSVIDWSRVVKNAADQEGKIRLLLLFFAIGLGYLVSTFFLDMLSMGSSLTSLMLNE